MRLLSSILLAGAAVAGLAIVAPTVARELDSHVMTVHLPGGGVETIPSSAAELEARVKQAAERFRAIVQKANIRPD